jgi:dTDP-4-amino-4,6-dideoxygalactose transaminase
MYKKYDFVRFVYDKSKTQVVDKKNEPQSVDELQVGVTVECIAQLKYIVFTKDRDNLLKYCHKKGIEAKIHYPKPLHIQKASKKINIKISLKNAERQSKELLTLPVHQFLNKKHLDYIINTMSNFYLKSK